MNIIVNQNSVEHNTSPRPGSVMFDIIHYTATDNATAQNELAYFSRKTKRNASADFFVNFDGTVIQYNTDPAKRYTYAVGGRKYPNTKGGSMYGRITNRNSISIEMCCRKVNGVWTITDETYKATIELARYIRQKYNLPAGRTFRHYDVTGKLCPNIPGFISPDNRWREMVAAIDGTTVATTQKPNTTIQSTNRTTGLSVDGSLGPASVKAMQRWLGTPVDGVVSGQPMVNKKYLPACPSNWKFVSHGVTGSMMIRRLQSKIGAGSDGYCGKGTVTALQKYLRNKGYNISADGYLGSATAKALQRFLNTL